MSATRPIPTQRRKLPHPEMAGFQEMIHAPYNAGIGPLIDSAVNRCDVANDTRKPILKLCTNNTPFITTSNRGYRSHRHSIIFVVCEGGLFGRQIRDNMLATKVPFTWLQYYQSLLAEKVDIRAVALLRFIRECGDDSTLICSTPQQYAYIVKKKLEIHNLRSLFTNVVYKTTSSMPTAAFFEATLKKYYSQNKLLYSTSWKPQGTDVSHDWFL